MKDPYHLFYNNIVRIDDLKAPDLDRDFSAVKMRWGDQYLVPANVIHAYFAARMTQKDGFKLEDARAYLKDVTKQRISRESSMCHWRADKCEFQNFEVAYTIAMYNKTSGNTDYQNMVLEKVYEQIPDLDSYPREVFDGPCDTKIHIIGSREAPSLISQMGEAIAKRKDVLTGIAEERVEALHLLEQITPTEEGCLFLNGELSENRKGILRSDLSHEQISYLERLVAWKAEGEGTISGLPEKPDDDIPF